MIDHLSLGVNDMKKSAAFYDAVLGTLGIRRIHQENGDDGAPLAIGYGVDRPVFWIDIPLDTSRPASACNGTHIGFKAGSVEAVQNFHKEALRLGGKDAGMPGPRPEYHEHYYAAFVYDPEGHKIEAVFGNS